MARYIDADKADVERISCFYCEECRLEDVQEWLDEQPTADVVEVKHGEWIDNTNGTFTCSVCGGKASKMDWCGRCGAKMDGRRDT